MVASTEPVSIIMISSTRGRTESRQRASTSCSSFTIIHKLTCAIFLAHSSSRLPKLSMMHEYSVQIPPTQLVGLSASNVRSVASLFSAACQIRQPLHQSIQAVACRVDSLGAYLILFEDHNLQSADIIRIACPVGSIYVVVYGEVKRTREVRRNDGRIPNKKDRIAHLADQSAFGLSGHSVASFRAWEAGIAVAVNHDSPARICTPFPREPRNDDPVTGFDRIVGGGPYLL